MAQLIFPLLLFAGLYFILIRPQQQKLKAQQALVAKAAAGDRVLLSSGIYGTLTEVLATSAYVELAEGIEILVSRQSIQEILEEFPFEEMDELEDSQDAIIEDDEDDDADVEA